MNVTIPLAVSSGWWIAMPVCMLIMVMMFAMMGHGRAKSGRARWWSGRWPESRTETQIQRDETPIEVLDRRFAEGEISVEDYRERREELAAAGRESGVAAHTSREEER